VNTSFPRTARLTQRADFDHVFQAPERKSSDRCFTVLGRCRLQDGAARLGLVIARPMTTPENYIPAFRRRKIDEPGLLRKLARHAAEEHDNAAIARALARHWQRLFPEK